MSENAGSFLKLWIIDADQITGVNLRPNTLSNIISLEENFTKIEIPLTLDTGQYSETNKETKPSNTYIATIKGSMPVTDVNIALLKTLPVKKAAIILDYEVRYKLIGNKEEPLRFSSVLSHSADFNKGKFYKIEIRRKLKEAPIFISNPFYVDSGSGI